MALAWTDLEPEEAAAQLVATTDPNWARRFIDELDRTVRTEPLERFLELWGLSNAAAANVFGVSRQAFSKWLKNGPPSSRATAIADLSLATELLDRYVKRERIAAVVRRPAPVLENRSLLEIASSGDTLAVADATRAMFDLRRIQP